MAGCQDRRLEVVVLGARGLPRSQPGSSPLSLGEGRRKVQITLVGPKDPEGEAFGAKVSPWTDLAGSLGTLRFGKSGLLCCFPLGTAQGAPAVAADVRFTEVTRLRVRLLASQVPSGTSALRAAAQLLPSALTGLAGGVSHELDEATAQVEAEAQIPLANILSGRVGFAADRALGGWVPLRRLVGASDAGGPLEEDPPLSVWMQMYVLPDHEAMMPSLRAQLEDELARQPGAGAQARAQAKAAEAAKQAAGGSAPSRSFADIAAINGERRWGPAASPTQTSSCSASPVAQAPDLLDLPAADLIDVSLDDDEGGAGAGSTSLVRGGMPDLLSVDDGCWSLEPTGPLPKVAQGAPGGIGGASAFSFVGTSTGVVPDEQAATKENAWPICIGEGDPALGFKPANLVNELPTGPSAFGFIAASSPGAPLDLAALYRSSEATTRPAPTPVSPARYSALSELGPNGRPQAHNATPGKVVGNVKTLQTMEESLLADLSKSLRF